MLEARLIGGGKRESTEQRKVMLKNDDYVHVMMLGETKRSVQSSKRREREAKESKEGRLQKDMCNNTEH